MTSIKKEKKIIDKQKKKEINENDEILKTLIKYLSSASIKLIYLDELRA